MQPEITRPADRWSPTYFLASVGAGGLAVTFFMWLYHWVPHPGQPVPVFEDLALAFTTGGMAQQAMIVVAAVAIAVLAFLNLKLLAWNLGKLSAFRRTEGYQKLIASNAESQLATLPLALAMAINVGFILGLVFVPGLWGVVEYLFPLAMIAFVIVGGIALRQLGRFYGRVFGQGGFTCSANNSFGQVLPAFALAMVGVGLSAPAALSLSATTSGIALILSTFFLVAAALIAVVAVVLGFRAMLENGANPETAPTIMIVIPLVTVLGILLLRQDHALHVHFGEHTSAGASLWTLTQFLSVQVLFGLLGLAVLARQGYAAKYITGPEASAGSYALVCPGVALSVMMQFWINKGLVGAGLIAKFGVAYWTLSAVAVAFQVAMLVLVVILHRKHFSAVTGQGAPAIG
jgi:hypothetical protein